MTSDMVAMNSLSWSKMTFGTVLNRYAKTVTAHPMEPGG